MSGSAWGALLSGVPGRPGATHSSLTPAGLSTTFPLSFCDGTLIFSSNFCHKRQPSYTCAYAGVTGRATRATGLTAGPPGIPTQADHRAHPPGPAADRPPGRRATGLPGTPPGLTAGSPEQADLRATRPCAPPHDWLPARAGRRPPGGHQPLKVQKSETAPSSRVSFREIEGWGYLTQNSKNRPCERLIYQYYEQCGGTS